MKLARMAAEAEIVHIVLSASWRAGEDGGVTQLGSKGPRTRVVDDLSTGPSLKAPELCSFLCKIFI